jgi:hypothetical protein
MTLVGRRRRSSGGDVSTRCVETRQAGAPERARTFGNETFLLAERSALGATQASADPTRCGARDGIRRAPDTNGGRPCLGSLIVRSWRWRWHSCAPAARETCPRSASSAASGNQAAPCRRCRICAGCSWPVAKRCWSRKTTPALVVRASHVAFGCSRVSEVSCCAIRCRVTTKKERGFRIGPATRCRRAKRRWLCWSRSKMVPCPESKASRFTQQQRVATHPDRRTLGVPGVVDQGERRECASGGQGARARRPAAAVVGAAANPR